MDNNYGLYNRGDQPQEYKLSQVLREYRDGVNRCDLYTIQAADPSVADGYVDFHVPFRKKPIGGFFANMKRFWEKVCLAKKVMGGQADILYYE